jgi:hypothetical protein
MTVSLVTRPGEVEEAGGAVVDTQLRVVAVVRMRQADVVPELVQRGRGEGVELPVAGRSEGEHEALRAVDPVVVGEPEQAQREVRPETRVRGVEREHGRHVVARSVGRHVGGTVLVEVAEQLGERIAERRPAVVHYVVQREDVERPLGAVVDRIAVAEVHAPAVVGLERLELAAGERGVDQLRPLLGGVVLEHRDVGDLPAEGLGRGHQRIVSGDVG